MKVKYFFLLLLTSYLLKAQKTKNIFLDRAFWKAKPTLELVKEKVKEGNDPSEYNKHKFDAISYALLEHKKVVDDSIIKYLLTKPNNDVNKLTHDGRTYIFWAAYTNRVALMKFLVNKGAKTDIIDSHGYSLLNFAAVSGQQNTKLYDYIIEKGANIKLEKNNVGANALLLVLPFCKDFTLINYFTSKGLSIYDKDNKGNGAINYAVKKENKELVAKLIEKGVPYKEKNKNGGTAMLMATKGDRKGYNSLEFFKYLETIGIEPNVTNKNGLTPLHNLAYGNKDIASFQYFLSKKVDVNKQNKEGNTPLMNACSKNALDIIKLLIKNTKNINNKNNKGYSALTNALKNTPEVIVHLLEQKANVFVEDAQGNNLAYHLVKSYNSSKEDEFLQKINLLEAKGFKIRTPQKDGNTLVHLAANKGDVSLMKFLKRFDIDINTKNKEGETALQKAVMVAKNPEIVKLLLENGADKNVTTSFNETVYSLAKENEQLSQFDLNFLK